jgi:flagellar basal body-associated protein FliL
MEPERDKPAKGYGKRPMWQWIVIYVVVAAIVYALIYFIFIHKSGSGTSGGGLY